MTGPLPPSPLVLDPGPGQRQFRLWFWITLAMAALPYAFLVFSLWNDPRTVIQDDARHFVPWIRRLTDPGLYPHDIMADYFATITPWLYSGLFWPFSRIGVDPITAYMFIVTPLTGVLLAVAAYLFIHKVWPSPMGASFATLVLINLLEWPLGLAHDFGFAIALALLLAFVSRRAVACGVLMLLATGLLPVAALTTGLTMAFLMLSRRAPFVSRDRKAWTVLLTTGAACLVGGLLVVTSAAESGPTITAQEARSIPFFNPGGRRPFWGRTWVSTYLCNKGAGVVPFCESGSDARMLALTAFIIALLACSIWFVGSGRSRRWLMDRGLPGVDPLFGGILAAFVPVGLSGYLVAHAVAFKLHMPQRFVQYTMSLGVGLIAAITASVAFLLLLEACRRHARTRRGVAAALLAVTTVGMVWCSTRVLAASGTRIPSGAPAIEDYLRTTPKDTVVAGVVLEIDSVPAFGARTVLTSMELLVPYKKRYYEESARRLTDLALALYAPDPARFVSLRERYRIDYILVGEGPEPELGKLAELTTNFPAVEPALRFMAGGQEPFFRARLAACARVRDHQLVLADAACVAGTPAR